MNYLAGRLYKLRSARGLKQEELAEAIGVSRQAISKWEMGTGTPTLDNLVALSDYFGVSLDSLVKDVSPSPALPAEPPKPLPAAAAPPKNTAFEAAENNGPGLFASCAINIILIICLQAVSSLAARLLGMAVSQIMPVVGLTKYTEYIINWLSTPLSIPLLLLLFVIFDRGGCPFTKNLYDKNKPSFFRYGFHKVIAVLLLRYPVLPLIFDLAVRDADFVIKSNIFAFVMLSAYLIVFPWGGRGLGKRPLIIFLMILATGAVIVLKSVVDFYSFHKATGKFLQESSLAQIPLTSAILGVYTVCQMLCLKKQKEKS